MVDNTVSNVHDFYEKPRRRIRWEWLASIAGAGGIAALVFLVPWVSVGDWITDISTGIWDLLGWGLVIIAIAVVTVAVIIATRRWSLFVHRWNHVLGWIAVLFAAWGILGLLDIGGSFGSDLIGFSEPWAYVRIIGFFALSVLFIIPDVAYFIFIKPFRQIRPRQRTPDFLNEPPPAKRPSAPAAEGDDLIEPTPDPEVATVDVPTTITAEPAAKPAQPRQLKQVAKDIWKKYGENATVVDGWKLPPIEILDRSADIEFDEADNIQRARLIEEALASYGVETKVVQINAGPTVTQFGVEPGWDRRFKEYKEKDKDGNTEIRRKEVSRTRVKVDRITSLANDMALALAAPSIRIEAPVPGKSIVGIEVPNTVSSAVSLRSVIESNPFQKAHARSSLALGLGKGAGGEVEAGDLGKMPHLLIAGATGSGKTVCLNSIICCLLMHNTPNDLRLIMIDPKRVELTPFNSIPHLATPVIVDTAKALDVLRWLSAEMDRRYQMLAKATTRNIDGYNKKRQGIERMPYLVLVIDELADLMMTGFDEVEHILCRLAQLSRAVGIHLLVATQRPSVDVVTGLIKANFPTRISFAVTSQVDSRTILDGVGAEKLLGRGDMLYMPTEAGKPRRLQGSFVSDAETERLVYFWGSQQHDASAPMRIEEALQASATKSRKVPKDALLEEALQLAQEHDQISTSFLQRRLQIGYPRAARLKEQVDDELAKLDEVPAIAEDAVIDDKAITDDDLVEDFPPDEDPRIEDIELEED